MPPGKLNLNYCSSETSQAFIPAGCPSRVSIHFPNIPYFLMQLPDYQRVIYKRTPLIEVIAQLRFPTILKINNHALTMK
jgi:hypothetical protein